MAIQSLLYWYFKHKNVLTCVQRRNISFSTLMCCLGDRNGMWPEKACTTSPEVHFKVTGEPADPGHLKNNHENIKTEALTVGGSEKQHCVISYQT